jgi:hypothetical protein
MEPLPHLFPGQRTLYRAQRNEARRFAQERIDAHLSTGTIEAGDERKAEQRLQQAYLVAGVPPPRQIHWVNGPLELLAMLDLPKRLDRPWGEWSSVSHEVLDRVRLNELARLRDLGPRLKAKVWSLVGARVQASVVTRVRDPLLASVWASVTNNLRGSHAWNRVTSFLSQPSQSYAAPSWQNGAPWKYAPIISRSQTRLWDSMASCVAAYEDAPWLAFSGFFDVYLAPNELHALARLNEVVSGYWFAKEAAILVRRPRLLAVDASGRLHSANGKCVEYPDGWGFYAWHGVCVPERVILSPEQLTQADFLDMSNVEARRIIQERMGQRFVSEMGGKLIDEGPRGGLYEVSLRDDPEGVARYVQVQDASSERQYYLRVPPWIQTAEEAVAWTFALSVEEYRPTDET